MMFQRCRQRNVKTFYQGVFSKLLTRDFFLHSCSTVSVRDGVGREGGKRGRGGEVEGLEG